MAMAKKVWVGRAILAAILGLSVFQFHEGHQAHDFEVDLSDRMQLSIQEAQKSNAVKRARRPRQISGSAARNRRSGTARGDRTAPLALRRSQNDKPFFVLHVGLPKTATTHLQCALCGHASLTEPILLKDEVVYLGTCPTSQCPGVDNALPPQFLAHTPGVFFADSGQSDHVHQHGEPGANPVGPFPHALDPDRLRSTESTPELDYEFMKKVNGLGKWGKNVYVVFEGCHAWSHNHIARLAEFLLHGSSVAWDVHIVVAYRPLFDWLPSKYNSIIKANRNRAARIWPGHVMPFGRVRQRGGKKRLFLAGEEILPFAMDNRSAGHSPTIYRGVQDDNLFGDFVRDIEIRYRMHPTQMVQQNYGQYFDNVHIMSLPHLDVGHNKTESGVDPLLEYLFCSVLPRRTAQTCHAIRHGSLRNVGEKKEEAAHVGGKKGKRGGGGKGTTNPSVDFDNDLLAVQAFKEGLIQVEPPSEEQAGSSNEAPSRRMVTKMIQKRRQHEHISVEGYQTCWDQTALDRLEQLSWKVERKLFFSNDQLNDPKVSEAVYKQMHASAFAKAVAKGKFCNLDAPKTLLDPTWRDWFVKMFGPDGTVTKRIAKKKRGGKRTKKAAAT